MGSCYTIIHEQFGTVTISYLVHFGTNNDFNEQFSTD
jgi:hypothetical protein